MATTDKISVSIGITELRQAKRLASQLGESLSMFITEAVRQRIARLAGTALTLVPEAQTIDAIIMASAAQRGGEIVYTSDVDDLTALRDGVPQFASIGIEHA